MIEVSFVASGFELNFQSFFIFFKYKAFWSE
jgi:hypothetical protein